MVLQILVVDDDPMMLSLLSHILEHAGYRVAVAESGTEALRRIAEELPDLVILDIMMPHMDGFEVCRHLRRNPAFRRTPVIMLTARVDLNDKVKGFEAGADDYVTKPVIPAELVARVKAQLSRTEASSRPQGDVLGVLGVKGGVGVTTLSVNLSLALHEVEAHTLLADLSPNQASVWRQFGLRRSDSLARLLRQDQGVISQDTVQQCLVTHESGLRILAPLQVTLPVRRTLTAVQADRLVKSLRALATHVVIDFGASLNESTEFALRRCGRVILVTEQDRLALQSTTDILARLQKIGIRPEYLGLIVNCRTPVISRSSPAELESSLGITVWGVVSPAADVLWKASDEAVPVLIGSPESSLAKEVRGLAGRLVAV
jgi:DNA-binding response OmpR family regulator